MFLDVVGKMILSLTDNNNIPEFGPKFKLTLYYAAKSEDEAIGITLLKLF